MRRFVFRSPRLGFLAVGPALARPAAAFYHRNRAAFAPFDPVQPEDFFTEEGQAERLAEELSQLIQLPGAEDHFHRVVILPHGSNSSLLVGTA